MTRTCDLLVRSQTLYPTELRAQRGETKIILPRPVRYFPAGLRNASTLGARLFGLSKLNDRASPNCSRTYVSVVLTAFSSSLFFAMNAIHAIDSVAVSYSHRPTSRPRS